ncbi:hypothetical protein [Neorhizobium galegae]|uniref:hypothetical protein n=1 Tax=Neorhizobium galegae TaxID=399 RepID=UPI00127196AB|nr:hypothetical protein [Neorhizobium galegae]KAA9384180.1 hypothetical protein F4V88_28640 [Neorhizobium galegae]MCM2498844.1 hypothetical protein [Neorhizobium galegae]
MAFVMTVSAPALASASGEIDQALLRIERVGPRLSAMPSAVEDVVKAATDRGNTEASKAGPILEPAVRASFDPKGMVAEISGSLAGVADGKADPAALVKAAAAFEGGRKKVADMYESQDQATANQIEARIAGADDGPRIKQLADLMASPDLAAETALTAQVMYVSLEAFSDPNSAELASASPEKLKSELGGVVTSLRDRTENEKPLPKDIARMEEKARLTFTLALLPKEDLSVLSDFYQSAEGKAKRQALVESYKQVSGQANTRMLGEYFSALAGYLKTHPRPQQQ